MKIPGPFPLASLTTVKTEFPQLLAALIAERFPSRAAFIAVAQPDANQAGALAYLSQVITGKRPPPPHTPRWADALGLKGAKKADFMIAAALCHVPSELRQPLLDRLG